MYLIDKTYFNGSINIASSQSVHIDKGEGLDMDIDKYVRLFLQRTLGWETFEELDSYILEGVLQNDAPQKYKDLVNGVTYTHEDKVCRWQGLAYSEGLNNISLMAYFVYYQRYLTTINSGLGQAVAEPKNGMLQNPSEHLTSVWNEFILMYQGNNAPQGQVYNFGQTLFVDFYGMQNENQIVNLLQYLGHKKDDFENVNAPFLNFQNRLL